MSAKAETQTRLIEVGRLARVEGEGSLHLEIEDGRVTNARFSLCEPPRFFEAFLRGRSYREVPDITARICGICPAVHQMSAVHALEMAFGTEVGEPLRTLRRLLCCGEWIESHVLHIFLLHLPDFMGYESAISLAADHRELVAKALQLKKAGNELVSVLGGREVHPVNACVGGFHRVPAREELVPVAKRLRANRQFAVDACKLLGSLDFPDFEMPYDCVALRHPDEVALCEGSVVTSRGLEVPVSSFLEHFEEVQVEHSTALQGRLRGRGVYLVGPLARLNLNWDLYPDPIKELAGEIGFAVPCNNQFKSIVARGLETLYALDHALEIIENYRRPQDSGAEIAPRRGEGHACTEAPRGILYHRYRTNEDGSIEDALICTPTAQNQRQIEADLAEFAPRILDLDHEQMTLRCEQVIRNYDPCISCATHFLKLTVHRDDG